VAAAMNKADAVRWLLAQRGGKTAAGGAVQARGGDDAGAAAVRSVKPAPRGMTPLHCAAAAGAAVAAEAILSRGFTCRLNPIH
jgi:hypothetical protein